MTTLDTEILPYVIFLIVPILGRMSDVDESARLVSTNCFAMLIKLVPLEVIAINIFKMNLYFFSNFNY